MAALSSEPSLFFGATVLETGCGGIACVARMSLAALASRFPHVSGMTLHDAAAMDLPGIRVPTARGSRLKYLARCHAGALAATHAFYDSVGTARAHPRLPGMRRPYAVWIHGVEVWHGLHRDREQALRSADLVLVNSRFTLDRFQAEHFRLDNARVCHLAAEADDEAGLAPDAEAARASTPTLLVLGRIDAGQMYKGHAEIIAAWSDVVGAVPRARLVIAGGGTGLDMARDMARHSRASSSIDVLGFVPDETLEILWSRATAFAMPSRGEGFGLVYVEAMRHSVPVIASTHDAGQEVNAHGETGYNVALDRPRELTEAIIALLGNPATARNMGAAGRRRWREHFRRSAFDRRFLDIVDPFVRSA